MPRCINSNVVLHFSLLSFAVSFHFVATSSGILTASEAEKQLFKQPDGVENGDFMLYVSTISYVLAFVWRDKCYHLPVVVNVGAPNQGSGNRNTRVYRLDLEGADGEEFTKLKRLIKYYSVRDIGFSHFLFLFFSVCLLCTT